MRAICWQESRWQQFKPDGTPQSHANVNGTTDWGCMQINQATNRQIWHWPSNVAQALALFAQKVAAAKAYLNQHPGFTQDMLDNESIQRYNGGVYYKWDQTANAWKASPPAGNNYVASVRELVSKKPWASMMPQAVSVA